MSPVTVQLSDETIRRLDEEAQRLNLPLEAVINRAIMVFLEDDDLTEAAIPASLRTGMQQALTGNYRPAHEVLDEIEVIVEEDSTATLPGYEPLDWLKPNPMTGAEFVKAGLMGGWEQKGITDSLMWLAEQRRKQAE